MDRLLRLAKAVALFLMSSAPVVAVSIAGMAQTHFAPVRAA